MTTESATIAASSAGVNRESGDEERNEPQREANDESGSTGIGKGRVEAEREAKELKEKDKVGGEEEKEGKENARKIPVSTAALVGIPEPASAKITDHTTSSSLPLLPPPSSVMMVAKTSEIADAIPPAQESPKQTDKLCCKETEPTKTSPSSSSDSRSEAPSFPPVRALAFNVSSVVGASGSVHLEARVDGTPYGFTFDIDANASPRNGSDLSTCPSITVKSIGSSGLHFSMTHVPSLTFATPPKPKIGVNAILNASPSELASLSPLSSSSSQPPPPPPPPAQEQWAGYERPLQFGATKRSATHGFPIPPNAPIKPKNGTQNHEFTDASDPEWQVRPRRLLFASNDGFNRSPNHDDCHLSGTVNLARWPQDIAYSSIEVAHSDASNSESEENENRYEEAIVAATAAKKERDDYDNVDDSNDDDDDDDDHGDAVDAQHVQKTNSDRVFSKSINEFGLVADFSQLAVFDRINSNKNDERGDDGDSESDVGNDRDYDDDDENQDDGSDDDDDEGDDTAKPYHLLDVYENLRANYTNSYEKFGFQGWRTDPALETPVQDDAWYVGFLNVKSNTDENESRDSISDVTDDDPHNDNDDDNETVVVADSTLNEDEDDNENDNDDIGGGVGNYSDANRNVAPNIAPPTTLVSIVAATAVAAPNPLFGQSGSDSSGVGANDHVNPRIAFPGVGNVNEHQHLLGGQHQQQKHHHHHRHNYQQQNRNNQSRSPQRFNAHDELYRGISNNNTTNINDSNNNNNNILRHDGWRPKRQHRYGNRQHQNQNRNYYHQGHHLHHQHQQQQQQQKRLQQSRTTNANANTNNNNNYYNHLKNNVWPQRQQQHQQQQQRQQTPFVNSINLNLQHDPADKEFFEQTPCESWLNTFAHSNSAPTQTRNLPQQSRQQTKWRQPQRLANYPLPPSDAFVVPLLEDLNMARHPHHNPASQPPIKYDSVQPISVTQLEHPAPHQQGHASVDPGSFPQEGARASSEPTSVIDAEEGKTSDAIDNSNSNNAGVDPAIDAEFKNEHVTVESGQTASLPLPLPPLPPTTAPSDDEEQLSFSKGIRRAVGELAASEAQDE